MRVLIAALLLALLTPITGNAQPGTIVLAADPWCPHTCDDDAAQPGYMIEIARRAFALKGVQVTYRNAAWARVMTDVREGRLDGAVGALATEAADLALHQEPLGHQANAMAVRATDPWTFTDLNSLNGRRIGTIQDYSYSPDIDAWLTAHQSRVQALGGQNALERNLKKLTAGRIDTLIDDEAVLHYRLKSWPDAAKLRLAGRIDGGDLFIAFSKIGNRGAELAALLDQGVRELRASGEFEKILATYGLKDWRR